MRFTVSQSALSRALSIVGKGIGANSTLPVLSGVHITAQAGQLELRTTDLTVSVKNIIPANVEEEGSAVLSCKLLTSIVKNLPDEPVSILTAAARAELNCGSGSYKLNALEAADFPEFPEYKLDEIVELPAEKLATMVDKVYRVTSRDVTRQILSGVLTTVDDSTLRLVATDSYRLAVCDTNIEASALTKPFEAVIPGQVFHDVLTLPENTERIVLGYNDNQVAFTYGDTTFIARKIGGTYPNYRQLLPSTCATSATVKSDELAAALKRVAVIAASSTTVRLDIDVEAGKAGLYASYVDQGEAHETINADAEGKSTQIGLNYHYVSDCMSAVGPGQELTIELEENTKPGIFKAYGETNYLYLLMPIRM